MLLYTGITAGTTNENQLITMIQKNFLNKESKICLIFLMGYMLLCCNRHDVVDSKRAVILEYQNHAKLNDSNIMIDSLVMLDEKKINWLEYDSIRIEQTAQFIELCKKSIELHTRAIKYKAEKSKFAFQDYSENGFMDYSAEIQEHESEIELFEKKIKELEKDMLDLGVSTHYELDTIKGLKILTYYLEAVIGEKNIADTFQMIFDKGYNNGMTFDNIFHNAK